MTEAGILGGAISGIANAATSIGKNTLAGVGSALTAAQDPGKGLSNIAGVVQDISRKQEQNVEKLKGTPFTVQNPPKVGSIVATRAPIYGVTKQERNPNFEPEILKRKPNASPAEIQNANREFLPTKVQTLIPNAMIFAKITKDIDPKTSTYGVALTDEKGNPSQQYVFAQTENAPYWQIYDATKTPEDDILVDEQGIPMKLTAIMTGMTKNDVSDPLKYWVDYKEYLNQNKPAKNI